MPARYAPGAGSIQFWLWPARTFQLTSQGFVCLQDSVCFNWTVVTQKSQSRTCYQIAYARAISMFSTGWHLSARGTRAYNIVEWSQVIRSLIRIFGYRIVYFWGKNLCKPHFTWVIWRHYIKEWHPFGSSQNSWGHRKLKIWSTKLPKNEEVQEPQKKSFEMLQFSRLST